eukprot:209442-Rhodomonas_salina.1
MRGLLAACAVERVRGEGAADRRSLGQGSLCSPVHLITSQNRGFPGFVCSEQTSEKGSVMSWCESKRERGKRGESEKANKGATCYPTPCSREHETHLDALQQASLHSQAHCRPEAGAMRGRVGLVGLVGLVELAAGQLRGGAIHNTSCQFCSARNGLRHVRPGRVSMRLDRALEGLEPEVL